MRDLSKSVLRLAAALLLSLFLGCSASGPNTGVAGGNPLTPPGPPAEIPASLRIPNNLSIDLGKVGSGSSAGLTLIAPKTKNAVPPDGEFSDAVTGTTETVQFFIDSLSALLAPYNQLVIPVGTNIHAFQGVSVVQGAGEPVFVEIKIDFSPFDFDNDGFEEPCSGNTAVLPICMRIYADGTKEIAAVFTQFPTETNPGAGRLMGLNITNAAFLFPLGSFLSINYDLHDLSAGRTVEFLVRDNPEQSSNKELRFHMLLEQIGEESVSQKTINFNFFGEAGEQQAVARWSESQDFWSGRVNANAESGSGLSDLDNQCVSLSTGDGLNRSECLAAGVDVGEVPFVPLPDENTLFLPKDFPDSPPF